MKKALSSLLVILFAAAAFFSGMDRLSALVPGLERTVPGPFRANAARSAAAMLLTRGRMDEAHAQAAQAVRHDPVDPHSTSVLGTVRLNREDYEGAYEAYRAAALFGWRDASTQAYWYGQALGVEDWDVAMDRADALLRITPSLNNIDQILAPFEGDPAGRTALVSHLALMPEWMGSYFSLEDETSRETLAQRVLVIEEMGRSGHPAGCRLIAGMTRSLLERGERSLAKRVWNASCPEGRITEGLFDPSFDLVEYEDGPPFGWVLNRSGDLGILKDSDDAKGFHLLLSNKSPSTKLALSQYVDLEPGRYRLRASAVAGGRPSARLVATVGCGAAPYPTGIEGTMSAAGQDIEVPACDQQQLGIWILPGTGTVALDDLELTAVR